MRQVLPTKPLTNAILYGPAFFGHWKYLVWSDQGLKHSGLAPGPETTFGPAKTAADDMSSPAIARPDTRPSFFIWNPPFRSRPRGVRMRDCLDLIAQRNHG